MLLLASCHMLPNAYKQLERVIVDAFKHACFGRRSAHASDRYYVSDCVALRAAQGHEIG